MMIISMFSTITFLLTILMMSMASMLLKKTFMDREKNSPFECGFDPKNSSRLPFSIHFFLIAVIFLNFDVEITLLKPMIMIMKSSNLISWLLINFFFLSILIIGLYHDWNQGALNWSH